MVVYNYRKLYTDRFKVSKFTGQKRKTQNNCTYSYLAVNINVYVMCYNVGTYCSIAPIYYNW